MYYFFALIHMSLVAYRRSMERLQFCLHSVQALALSPPHSFVSRHTLCCRKLSGKSALHVHKIKFFRVYGKKMMKNANSCDESFEPDEMTNSAPELT